MALDFISLKGWLKGLNLDRPPHDLDAQELVAAQDVLIGQPGRLTRRQGYGIRSGTTFGGRLVATGRHAYHTDQGGVLVVTSVDDETFIYWLKGGDAPLLLLTVPVATAWGQIAGGYSSAPRDFQDEEQNRNAKYDSSVIATDQFVLTFKWEDAGFETTDTFAPTPDLSDYKNRSIRTAFNGSGKGRAEFVYIAGTLDEIEGYDPDQAATVAYPYWTHNLHKKGYKYVTSFGGYTVLAGRTDMPQHVWWSENEDSHHWATEPEIKAGVANQDDRKPVDFEHIPSQDTSVITGLFALQGHGVVFKTDSVHTLTPTGGPIPFSRKLRSQNGCLDHRGVAEYEQTLIYPGQDGIYMFDMQDTRELTAGKIGNTYRQLIKNWDENWVLGGAVVDDYYILTINSANTVNGPYFAYGSLVCHIPTGSWVSFSNLFVHDSCRSATGNGTWGFVRDEGNAIHMASLQDMFRSTLNVDAIGSGPRLVMETGRITLEDEMRGKSWNGLRLTYEATGAGQLQVRHAAGLTANAGAATPTVFGSRTMGTVRMRLHAHSPALTLRIEEDDDARFDSVTLYSVKLGVHAHSEQRYGG